MRYSTFLVAGATSMILGSFMGVKLAYGGSLAQQGLADPVVAAPANVSNPWTGPYFGGTIGSHKKEKSGYYYVEEMIQRSQDHSVDRTVIDRSSEFIECDGSGDGPDDCDVIVPDHLVGNSQIEELPEIIRGDNCGHMTFSCITHRGGSRIWFGENSPTEGEFASQLWLAEPLEIVTETSRVVTDTWTETWTESVVNAIPFTSSSREIGFGGYRHGFMNGLVAGGEIGVYDGDFYGEIQGGYAFSDRVLAYGAVGWEHQAVGIDFKPIKDKGLTVGARYVFNDDGNRPELRVGWQF